MDDDKHNTFETEQHTGAADAAERDVSQDNGEATQQYHSDQLDSGDEFSLELEQQARETIRVFRESAGDLGTRVRQVLNRASSLWSEVHPGLPGESSVSTEDELRARQLARSWIARDFLVDPDLADTMTVRRVHSAEIWRVELRERGETRAIVDASEPYTGERPANPGPILPVWDYLFPSTPEIESGERRERIAGTTQVAACRNCNGTGHRPCADCDGSGFVQCPICHGRARIPCRRCRGRARIADPKAERRARANLGYFQVQAERLRQDASERLVDFAERLRQDYGIPLPPTGQLVPLAPASGETIPCPDCVNGSIPCKCGNGKLVCESCAGTGASLCTACAGTGKVLRHRELARRFDTRISQSTLPLADSEMTSWLTEGMVRKSGGEEVWNGPVDSLHLAVPPSVPPEVWATTQEIVKRLRDRMTDVEQEDDQGQNERRVLSRRVSLERVPVTRVEYEFADQPFAFVAIGHSGRERYWAQEFPPRWSRVNRFLKALARDLQRDGISEWSSRPDEGAPLTHLDDFRARKAGGSPAADAGGAGTSNPDVAVRIQEARNDENQGEDES
ncbi:MAG: DnaJ-like cysteine-rich domain-containing protein [Ktedonobacterales bacterium]